MNTTARVFLCCNKTHAHAAGDLEKRVMPRTHSPGTLKQSEGEQAVRLYKNLRAHHRSKQGEDSARSIRENYTRINAWIRAKQEVAPQLSLPIACIATQPAAASMPDMASTSLRAATVEATMAPCPPGSSSVAGNSGNATRPLATTEVRIYMQGGSQPEQPDPATASSTVRAVALTLPSVTQLPRSVAWTLLRRNQLARDQGRPMYLVEASGETVLASDEEGEAHKSPPWHSSDGSAVDAALKGVATQLGCSEEVVTSLASALKISAAKVAARMRLLAPDLAIGSPEEAGGLEQGKQALAAAFCRRCYTYACRVHGGHQAKLAWRAAGGPPRASRLQQMPTELSPCSSDCWLRQQQEGEEGGKVEGRVEEKQEEEEEEEEGGQTQSQQLRRQPALQHLAGSCQAQKEGRGRPAGQQEPAGGWAGGWSGWEDALLQRGVGLFGPHGACSIAHLLGPAAPLAAPGAPPPAGTPANSTPAPDEPQTSPPRQQQQQQPHNMSAAPASSPAADAPSSSKPGRQVPTGPQPGPPPPPRSCQEVYKRMLALGLVPAAAATTLGTGAAGVEAAASSGGAGTAAASGTGARAVGAAAAGQSGLGGKGSGEGVVVSEQEGGGREAGRDAGFSQQVKKVKGVAPPGSLRRALILARFQHGNSKPWQPYTPCNCHTGPEGACTLNCPCLLAASYCEKYCGCGPACELRCRGCQCAGTCRTARCPCMAAGRECDPDLCRTCTMPWSESQQASLSPKCGNMRLRLRQHKRVVLANSSIAGWGAFLADGAGKDEFLGEYTGDLITQAEADRRGRVYDQMNNSYLFDLNERWVLDARYRGNKMRCANHSAQPNCKVRILQVDGDHRVAIFANKNIAPGEELFYDYRYDREHAPNWAQKR